MNHPEFMRAKVMNESCLPAIFTVENIDYLGVDEFWNRHSGGKYTIVLKIHHGDDNRGMVYLCGNKTMISVMSDDAVSEAEAVRMHQNLSELLRQCRYVNLCIGEEDCILNKHWKVVLV